MVLKSNTLIALNNATILYKQVKKYITENKLLLEVFKLIYNILYAV